MVQFCAGDYWNADLVPGPISPEVLPSFMQVDEWLKFAPTLAAGPGLADAVAVANDFLSLRTFLVGHSLTLADIAVWGQLTGRRQICMTRHCICQGHQIPCYCVQCSMGAAAGCRHLKPCHSNKPAAARVPYM